MAVHTVNNSSVVMNGGFALIMIAPDPETVNDLRELLAKVNSEGVGDTPEGVRQLLSDTEAALQSAFRPARVLRSWKPGDDVS